MSDFLDLGALQASGAGLDIGPLQAGAVSGIVGSTGIASAAVFGVGGAVSESGAIVGTLGIPTATVFGAGGSINAQTISGSTGIPTATAFGATGGKIAFGILGDYGIPTATKFGLGALTLRPFTVFINGIDQTDTLLVNTLQINMQVSQVTTAQWSMHDASAAAGNIPQVGQMVLIYRAGVRVFGGYIEKPTQAQYMARADSIFAGGMASGAGGGVTASDFSSMLDRRIVGEYYDSFSGGNLYAIVTDLVRKYLAQDGFSYDASNGTPSTVIANQLFDWVTARQALQTLSSVTGWDFHVDSFQVIRFFPSGAGQSAPFGIADNDGHTLAESLTVTYDRSTYRNRQGVRAPSQGTAVWTDLYSTARPGPLPGSPQPPDGHRRFYVTKYAITATPTVRVNGVAKVVKSLLELGGKISQPGYDFFWDPPQDAFAGGNFVEQSPLEAPLASTDVLTVGYPTQLSPIVWVQDDAQIAARAAIEGNSGIYEDVQNAPTTMTDPGAQLQYAEALLARYGAAGIPYTVHYETITDGLFPGMSQHVQQTTPAVNLAAGLITQVQMRDVDKTYFRYSVTVSSALYLASSAAEFFAALALQVQQGQPSNRNTYTWQLAPSYPGVTNPGLANTGALAQYYIVQHAVELMLLASAWATGAPDASDEHLEVLVNTNGTGPLILPKGEHGPLSIYYPATALLHAGDIVQLLAGNTAANAGFKDGVFQLTTAVLVN